MTPLHSKIMRRVEFDDNAACSEAFVQNFAAKTKTHAFVEGARWQSEQNKPLIEALAKVADCADLLSDWAHEDCGLAAALSSLAGIVGDD